MVIKPRPEAGFFYAKKKFFTKARMGLSYPWFLFCHNQRSRWLVLVWAGYRRGYGFVGDWGGGEKGIEEDRM